MDSMIAESLNETLDALKEWLAEQAVEFAANAMQPGLGHVINIALTIKEIASDAEGPASPDSARNLHVRLLHLDGGLVCSSGQSRCFPARADGADLPGNTAWRRGRTGCLRFRRPPDTVGSY
jgi:hypothetical protein